MTLLLAWGAAILHVLLMLPAALLVEGFAISLRARLCGIRGPGLLMPFRALSAALLRQIVRGPDASLVTVIGPASVLAVTLAAACLVPSFTRNTALAGAGDLLTVAGLLTLARMLGLLLAGAAEDSGALLAEPAVLLAVFSHALPAATAAPIAFAALAVAGIALAAGPQVASGASGRDLAMLGLAAALRRLVFLTLIADLLRPPLPPGPDYWPLGFAIWLGTVLAATTLSVVTEVALPARLPGRRREALAVGLMLAALAALVGIVEAAS